MYTQGCCLVWKWIREECEKKIFRGIKLIRAHNFELRAVFYLGTVLVWSHVLCTKITVSHQKLQQNYDTTETKPSPTCSCCTEVK